MVAKPRRRAIAFGALIAVVVIFWLAGQAATLHWQVHHLVTHTPEVVDDAHPTGGAPDQGSLRRQGAR